MSDSFDLSSLIGEFRDEARGQLEQLDGALLTLEERGSLPADEVTALLRGLHTLKGNSGMLGFRRIVDAVHAIEGVFKDSEPSFSRERLDLLFEGAAAIRQAVEQAGTGAQEAAATRLDRLNLGARLEASASAMPEPAPAAGTGIDDAERTATPAPPASAAPTPAADAVPAPPSDSAPAAAPARPRTRADPQEAEPPDAAGEFLRVPFAKLDDLLDLVGELSSAGASLEALLERYDDVLARAEAGHPFAEVAERLDRITRSLRSSTMEIRLVPVQRAFSRFPSLARDLAREQGKRVRVVLEGGEVELDKSMVDALADPLLHLVRNAVDHGIAPPAEREASGRPPTGTIVLRAAREGDRVRIEVADDGAGLDREALRRTARSLGIVGEQESLTPAETAELIFRPGFSTRSRSDTVSGRGIGLDAVKQRVTALRGTLTVDSPPNGGTRFVLGFPLTLAILPALIFEAEGEMFALPAVSVERTLRGAKPEAAGAAEVLRDNGELIPVSRAERVFGWSDPSAPGGGAPFAVVIRSGARRAALLASRLVDQRDLVVRALPRFLRRVPAVSGASVAPDGRVILLLDPAGLLELNLDLHQREKRAFTAPQDPGSRG
jgi:two-component system chemotaxis sensor kinase CheA